jgi:hypothetical protein
VKEDMLRIALSETDSVLGRLQDLIKRAAELLRDEPYNRGDQREWRRRRSEWLRDAGMEK